VDSRSESFREKAILSPDNLLLQFSLGQALVEEGKEAKALEPLQRCRDWKSDWMSPRILLGQCFIATDQKESALAVLNEALQLAIDQAHEDPEAEIRELIAEISD